MIDIEIGGSAVEVERDACGWVAGVAVPASKGAVFDDGSDGDVDVCGYRHSK